MFWKKGLGIGLIFTGIYLILTNAFLTGAVVGFGKENILGMVGVLVVIVGAGLILSTRTLTRRVREAFGEDEEVDRDSDLILRRPEYTTKKEHEITQEHHEAHNAVNYERLKKMYRDKKSHITDLAREYNQIEVSLEDLEELKNWANRKVESGEWVELKAITARSAENQRDYPQGTSLCRYWGPKQYKDYSGKRLEDLYLNGKIGKTHEIVRGSDKYREGGSLAKGDVSMPPVGARVLHRHWEIEKMYQYRVRASKEG